MSKKLTHLDLFSGIGGFALAAKWADIETVLFCEKDDFCRKVLSKHWPEIEIKHDIKDFNGLIYRDQIDIITAGFPCQPFSVAGKQKGKDDDRYLWPDTMRIIQRVQPTWCILENVPGIIPHLDPILEDLEGEGYDWRAFLVPASAVGAPHKRERLWIAAHTNSKQCDQKEIYKDAKSKRPQWKKSCGEIRDVTSNANNISSLQTNQSIMPTRESGEAWQNNSGESRRASPEFDWEKSEPPIPGVDDGLPNGMDRNKSLGNAIVPQIPYLFFKMIKVIEGR